MSLTGFWMNELRSVMLLHQHDDGALVGKYRSIVGRDPHPRILVGRVSSDEESKRLLGFAVCFEITPSKPGSGHFSLCTWSGWSRRDNKIITKWLLTAMPLDPNDEWASTLVGGDEFEKVFDEFDEKHICAEIPQLERYWKEFREKGSA
jgi:hypothetical protein